MNFSDVLKALNEASSFELYRMRAAIDRVLDEPHRIQAIHQSLQVGQSIDYFDGRSNRLCKGLILELRRKVALILDLGDNKQWLVEYAAINIDGADVKIREQVSRGLGRHEIGVGDTVGFLDRNQRQRSGRIIRLNDKTVTLMCEQQQWRVGYEHLHRVLDVEAAEQNMLELEVVSISQT